MCRTQLLKTKSRNVLYIWHGFIVNTNLISMAKRMVHTNSRAQVQTRVVFNINADFKLKKTPNNSISLHDHVTYGSHDVEQSSGLMGPRTAATLILLAFIDQTDFIYQYLFQAAKQINDACLNQSGFVLMFALSQLPGPR